uniref:Uncharacterized protein n=1 Tax=Glossina brevipalpis TaxID=37001 RepID=A0A1A9W1H8_9MUSC
MKVYFINCLILILTVQNCLANADNEQLNEQNKLFELTLSKFLEFTLEIGELSEEYITKTFKELEKNNDISNKELTEREHNKFLQTLEGLKNSKTNEDKLAYMKKLTGEIIYSSKHLEDPNMDEETTKFIEKYHAKEFLKKIHDEYFEFFEGFAKAFNEYANELNETQKEAQKELFNWFKEFSDEKNFVETTEKFLEFFNFFDDEE